MKALWILAAALLGGYGLAGGPAVAADDGAAAGIAWFDGTVDAAFAQARAQHKPVFLYWGASWCPPCHELKATVFSRPEFIEKSKLFVAVHLDGDDPGAQKWGDVFHVVGYPTVVVLRDPSTELARISGGMDLREYGEVLDLVLRDVDPVPQVLASLKRPGSRLSADDCRRLAYYAWDDLSDGISDSQLSRALRAAAASCPTTAHVERMRLTVAATAAAVSDERDALKAGKPPTPALARLVMQDRELLGEPAQAVRAADLLQSLDESFFSAVKRVAGVDAQELLQRWVAVMDRAAADARYADADRLGAVESKLRAIKAVDGSIPPALVVSARQRIDAVLAGAHDEHARTSDVNAALNVLEVLGDDARADAILHQQLALSRSPYYYMPDIAALEEKRGHQAAALAWYARGYHESQGAATRFQWGTQYVLGLVRLTPGDDAQIRSAGLAVLGELDGPDRIYSRTRKLLQRLDAKLRQWNEHRTHGAVIAALRQRMQGICTKIPTAEPARQSCSQFLAAA